MTEYDEYFRYMEEFTDSLGKLAVRDENVCNSCNGANLRSDRSNGTVVCCDCGVVNSDHMIDYSAEWNYSGEDSTGKDPSRCGCPVNPLLENSSLSTVIGKGGGQRYWLMKKIHQQNSMDYVERARWHVFEHITYVCDRGSLPANVLAVAKQYYTALSRKKLTRGGVRKGLIACCVLYACKAQNVPRTIKEISQMSDVECSKITSACKLFEELMADELKRDMAYSKLSTATSDLIYRFCNCIGVNDQKEICGISQHVSEVNRAVDEAKILIGKTPGAIASGTIFYTLVEMGYKVNKKRLADNHNISIVTLNKISAAIRDFMNSKE